MIEVFLSLHEEIIDFFTYVCPSPEEHWVREIIVSKVRNVISSLWRECKVEVFGSFSTGLYLPTSDVDIVIFGKWPQLPLGTLERALRENNFATDIKVLSKATVPIVKFTDSDTGLHVDISFNMSNSVRAVKFVETYLGVYPCLRYLVFPLKQFLLLRELNEVWTGGLSSYALILMCISFLQQNARENETISSRNLGTLLLEFFEFYGVRFNYRTTGIKFSDQSSFIPKDLFVKNMDRDQHPPLLCIEDPLCPGNNVARRSYSSYRVLDAFKHAYLTLSAALRPDVENVGTILSSILHIPPATLDSRKRQASSKPSPTQSSECSDDQLNNASSTTKAPIIVSARGLSTRPPAFLRAPNGADMLYLSTSLPSYAYHSNPIFYDPLCFPVQNPSNGAPPVQKPVFVMFSHSAFTPLSGPIFFSHYLPMHTPSSSVDGESTAMSRTVLDSGSDCDEILSESELHEIHVSDVTSAEIEEVYRDIDATDRTFKGGRSVSASNTCSNLVKQLAPLRLFSSEQNVSCTRENQELDCSCPLSSPSMLPSSSSTSSSTKSKDSKKCEQMEAELPQTQTPQPSQTRGGKSSRRRRRPIRKTGGVGPTLDGSGFATNTPESHVVPPRANGCCLSSNEEADEGACTCQSVHQMKRRCSQLRSGGNCHEGKVDGIVTASENTHGRAKAWSSFKPSIRMDSTSPEQNNPTGSSWRIAKECSKVGPLKGAFARTRFANRFRVSILVDHVTGGRIRDLSCALFWHQFQTSRGVVFKEKTTCTAMGIGIVDHAFFGPHKVSKLFLSASLVHSLNNNAFCFLRRGTTSSDTYHRLAHCLAVCVCQRQMDAQNERSIGSPTFTGAFLVTKISRV
ncbi:Terminal nucleotidyltransferase 4B [Taenia crassiceps]|uniref:Terminal nucleotidyltransferase 4B n=1 Tax=Taenia crassiceps TaxID=6207 RepID=A0ABR4Q9R9_9CEST